MSLSEDLSYKKRKETSGIGGQIYEIELAMLLLLQGIQNEKIDSFYLASNMEEAADFDDAVFKFHYKDDFGLEKTKIMLLQAKHKETLDKEEKKITLETLLSQSPKGEFILRKYCSSYYKIKHLLSQSKDHPMFNNLDNCELIIYTNAVFNIERCSEHVIKKIVESNHVLNIQEQSDENNYYLELNPTEKIIKALKPSLDFEILAQELSKVVSSKTLDMNKSIFNDYHFYLKEKVVARTNKREGRFREGFFKNKEFMEAMFKEIQTKKDVESKKIKSIDDLENCLSTLILELPEKFGNGEEGDFEVPFPSEQLSEDEIEMFLSKLKLFVSQPNERQLGDILQEKIRSAYHLEPLDIAVFADVKEKIQKWWRDGNYYLTKQNKFFQESAKVCFWFDVRPPTELFTGREEELEKLHSIITRKQETVTVISQVTSVSGLGGIGKTELARKYIDRFANDFQNNIIWINAENQDTLLDGFKRLAKDKLKINIKSTDGKDMSIESIVDKVYPFFFKRKSLFIFDNAVNSKDFTKLLPFRSLTPSDQKPYILITSRDQEWGKEVQTLDLFVLNVEDAKSLVKKGLGIQHNNNDKEIETLVKQLQYFPLAIRQAVAYIGNEMLTGDYNITDYLKDYDENKKELLKSEIFDSISNDYTKTTLTTWKITVNRISKDKIGHLALEILSIMAYIAPENINRDMFSPLSKERKETILAVRILVKYSMINGELKQSILSIHKLVQEVIRIELKDQDQQAKFMQKTFDLFNHIAPGKVKEENINVDEINQLLPHLEVFLSHTENWIPQTQNQPRFVLFSPINNWLNNKTQKKLRDKYLSQLFEWLNFGYRDYDPKRRITILEKMLEFHKKRDAPDKSYIADIIIDLALSHLCLSNYQKEKELLEEAVTILKETYGLEESKLIFPLVYLSSAYGFLGNHVKAKELLEEALKTTKKCYGTGHYLTSFILGRLADAHEDLGDLQKTEEHLEDALTCTEKHFGVDNINTVGNLESLVFVYEKLGDPQKQKELLERIIEISREYCAKDRSEEISVLKNLAFAYYKLKEHQKELEYRERIMKIEEELYGIDNVKVIDTLEKIGSTYRSLDNFQKHKEILERILKIKEKSFGQCHYKVDVTLNDLADAFGKLGDSTTQIQLLERSLKLNEEYYGPDHYKILLPLGSLVSVYLTLRDHETVKQLSHRYLCVLEDRYGHESLHLINTLLTISYTYASLRDYQKQKSFAERALKIAEKHDPQHFHMTDILKELSKAYKNLGDCDNQEKLLEKISKMKENQFNSNDIGIKKE